MTLQSGTRLGPYEITAPIGAGGMGEVYRASDPRLGREVAVKVLPAEFSHDPQLRARFDREARVVSGLNHPHICTVYDVGRADDHDYLVMEYLEGESLATRLTRGPLPLDQALRYGIEIADALDKAHRAGVVHRDLKPGNVVITKGGAKLLDFGLAKTMAQPLTASPASATAQMASHPLTAEGAIVGTFQYMAPEQIEGGEADARSDIFAFGALLYEMITGRRAFQGKSRASTIAQILEHEPPPVSSVQPMTPATLDRVVRTCLEKNPDERFQTAHDVMLELRWIRDDRSSASGAVARGRRPRPLLAAWSVAALSALVAVAAIVWGIRASRANHAAPIVASILPPQNGQFLFTGDYGGTPVLSRDGSSVAFVVSGEDGVRSLWVRSLGSPEARQLAGTANATFPFWSPDGRSVGYFSEGKLRRVDVAGGPPVPICETIDPRGAAWNEDDVIVFTPEPRAGLLRVPASGGTPVPLVQRAAGESTTRWPFFLPGGKQFVYLGASHEHAASVETSTIYLASVDGKEKPKPLVHATSNAIVAGGNLLFMRDGVLLAQRLNASKGILEGTATPVAQGVRFDLSIWRGVFSASENGVLLYQSGLAAAGNFINSYQQDGKRVRVFPEKAKYFDLDLSPDGRKLAVSIGDPQANLWLIDLESGTRGRLTFSRRTDLAPVWSPDGAALYYSTFEQLAARSPDLATTPAVLLKKTLESDAAEEVIARDKSSLIPSSISPDGKYLLLTRGDPPARLELQVLNLADRTRQSVASGLSAYDGHFSPDGKWISFTSYESDREELYVVPFPLRGTKWQVSTAGGRLSSWSRDGKRLYYVTPDNTLTAVNVVPKGSSFAAERPQPLFHVELNAVASKPYAVAPDGTFIVSGGEQDTSPLMLVTNWTSGLRK
jgi:serine/threonine protein kinase/Tol biopolymer transport system component